MSAPAVQSKPQGTTMNANDHAIALLKAAPEPLGSIALEICHIQGIQPWHFLLGHIIKADQRAELHAPLLLPEWTAASATPVVLGERICKGCGGRLTDKTRPGADFCCNYCGSGRYQRDQTHHKDCEFHVKPQRFLARKLLASAQAEPPADPKERAAWEAEQFERHLREAESAEATPGGLPALPSGPGDAAASGQGAWG